MVVGIFVGGAARRMGGIPKGLLRHPESGLSLVETLAGHAEAVCGAGSVVLVGDHSAYAHLPWPRLQDRLETTSAAGSKRPSGMDANARVGPLGGLAALLEHAAQRAAPWVISLACDLPRADRALLQALLSAAPDAALVAPRSRFWELLSARWLVNAALPVALEALASGQHALQPLAAALGATELPLADPGVLLDWDSPTDLPPDAAARLRPVE